MATIGEATVEVGDYLRRDVDGREGEVTATTNTTVTVRIGALGADEPFEDTLPAEDFHYNTWDPKFEASNKSAPTLEPTDMSTVNSDAYEQYKAQADAEAADAAAAVEAARAEAEETAKRVEAEQAARQTEIDEETRAREEELAQFNALMSTLTSPNVEEIPPDQVPEHLQEPVQTEEDDAQPDMGDLDPPQVTDTTGEK